MAEILGVKVDNLDQLELSEKLRGFLRDGGQHLVTTPNPEIILATQKDRSFKDCLNRADLALPDGFGLILISRVLNKFGVQKIQNRFTGVDTLKLLCSIAATEGKRVMLFGADPGVAEKAAEVMRKKHPGLKVKGFNPGFGLLSDGAINDFAPDILAVALGHGKQEQFICSGLADWPSVKIAIGVGGALDYISGHVKRAPLWMRRLGLEWLYRLIHQPQRIGRIFNAVVVFPSAVLWDRIKAL